MPTYAYRCRDCGHELEAHQAFSDAPLTECPVCGGVLRKQYGTVGVTFNGSGFYRTDSRAGEKNGGGKQDGGSGSSDAGSGSGSKDAPKKEAPSAAKSDAKPAAAPSS